MRLDHRNLAVFGLLFVLAGCPTCGGNTGEPGEEDSGTSGVSSSGGGVTRRDGGATTGSDGGTEEVDAGPGCLSACRPGHCGSVPDNCGAFIECPSCPEGAVCGLTEMNVCGVPPSSCEPIPAATACAGKCGAVSDGCDAVYTCDASNGGVSCAANQVCGGFAGALDPNHCVTAPGCTPLTCAQANAECGLVGDGCGGSLDCTALTGGCTGGKICGTGAASNTCVTPGPALCSPMDEATACAGTCGITGDGCGNQIDCEATPFGCPGTSTCGGGGIPGMCGTASASCMPLDVAVTCAGKCGPVSDGCGGTYQCSNANGGVTCDPLAGESCGGGNTPSACGRPQCTPRTMAQACPANSCGSAPDGCNGLIQCGTCGAGQLCGVAAPSQCASMPICQQIPIATACANKCGTVSDGCTGSYNCTGANGGVTCMGTQFCGATQPNKCGNGPMTCTAKTCAQLGHTCGLASNGCGGQLNCWPSGQTQCPSPTTQACIANSSGVQSCVTGMSACVGSFCNSLPSCPGANDTKLTGTVFTPGRVVGGNTINQIPVPNAVVYIPGDSTAALPDIFEGVRANTAASCGRCEDEKLVADGQSILASAVTDYRGRFTLQGRIPSGVAFNLVVKAGKWRRVIQVPANIVTSCSSVALPNTYSRLSKNPTDGLAGTWLPKIAIATGEVDTMECLFRNIGIDESLFTVPSNTNGRIHMYQANGARMGPCTGTYTMGGSTIQCSASNNAGCTSGKAGCSDATVPAANLYATQASINAYDMVVWDCEGAETFRTADNSKIENYVNNGGRMFASHYAYTWIEGNGTLAGSSSWTAPGFQGDSGTGFLSQPSGNTVRTHANPVKSVQFKNWLDWQGALQGTTAGTLDNPATPQFTIAYPRDRAGADVGASTDEWVYRDNSGIKVQQLSFNTPYGAANNAICGRVAYSGFHVANASQAYNSYFPNICTDAALTTQEKILVFMLFDLSACVSTGDPIRPPQCTAQTAMQLCPNANDACGVLADGCGGVVNCGGCDPGFYCDGSTCRAQSCTPATCATLGYNCGNAPDGCGGTARNSMGQTGCGDCAEPAVCGIGGAGRCGTPACVPIPMATACPAGTCGRVSNGCGGTHDCGGCSGSQVCGGGGANRCGNATCTKIAQSTACNGLNCGQVSDGCGGTWTCGTCSAPDSCGAGGQPNVCGHPSCMPKSMAQACQGLNCGWVSDGCGGAIKCGDCANGAVCGGGGPNVCGGTCVATTCDAENANCGSISNHCGGLLECGNCPSGQTCGAMQPNRCGAGPSCVLRTCAQAGAACGLTGDGCGGVLDCGACPGSLTCGGAGVANQCGMGTGACAPRTCAQQGVECAAASDGCGGLLDCGSCAAGEVCEDSRCVSIGG